MTTPTILVVAKAPVPGFVKTRLAAAVGDEVAARIAAAALLDTLAVVSQVGTPVVALTGRMDRAVDATEIRKSLTGCRVIPQRGRSFAHRLVNAHADADDGRGVVQVAMDTPQVTAQLLQNAWDALESHDAVLGHAPDGGWWLLGLRDAGLAAPLTDVPMSRPDTGSLTYAALASAGAAVATVASLTDVDTWHDAVRVAAEAPGTRFAHAIRRIAVGPEASAC